jgi:hypothetical protein
MVTLLGVTGYPQQGAQAPRIAEAHRGEVHNDRPVVAVDDPGDLADRRVGGRDIQFAADARDGFAGGQDPVAQFKRRSSAPVALAFGLDNYLLRLPGNHAGEPHGLPFSTN